jgi:hypothetical protein
MKNGKYRKLHKKYMSTLNTNTIGDLKEKNEKTEQNNI